MSQDAHDHALIKAVTAGRWGFLKGVVDLEGLPAPDRPEVAFAGRSNVGKSSLINALLGQKGLARTSNTPGRTQEINFFAPEAGDPSYLVDLPGYGYAKAPKQKVAQWTYLILDYLRGRPNLKRIFLLIDARHGIKANDHDVMDMLDEAAVSYLIVLTKLDKLGRDAQAKMLEKTQVDLKKHVAAFPEILATSSEKGWGLDDVKLKLAEALKGL